MKNHIQLVTIVVAITISAQTNAQIGRNLVKGLKKKDKELVLNKTTFSFTPAITMASLLYGTSLNPNGIMSFNNYTGSFIPYLKEDGSMVDTYEDQSQYLTLKVFKEGRKLVDYFEYDGSQTFDDYKLRKLNRPSKNYEKNGVLTNDVTIDFKKWGEGNYFMEFYVANDLFYTVDFEIIKVTNDDPYASKSEIYISKGPWNDYVYLEHQKSGNMIFGFYLQHDEFKPDPSNLKNTQKSISYTVEVFKDGNPFATHFNGLENPKKIKINQGEWKEFSTALKTVDKKKTIQLNDFTDGSYLIKVNIDMEEEPRLYSFEVVNGKIVLLKQQDRSKNEDPTRLIEGWNNFYWLKRQD